MFPLSHLCNVRPHDPLKLRELFRLVLEIDEYVEANKPKE